VLVQARVCRCACLHSCLALGPHRAGDDNDFGLGGNPQSQMNIVRLPVCLTQLYEVRIGGEGKQKGEAGESWG
jgi:hypothetical protein